MTAFCRFLCLAFLVASLQSPAADYLFADPVLARGKGVEVKRSQLEDAFVAFRSNLAARGQTIPEDKRQETENQLLDRLVITQLLLQRATTSDRAKAKEAAERFLDNARKSTTSEDAFIRQLKALGLTYSQFTNRVVEQAISEEVINREIKSKITITDEQVKQFYQEKGEAFLQPEMARASHILFSTRDPATRLDLPAAEKKTKRDKAEQVLARARAGEDFTKLAVEFSDDPAVKENKGEYKFTRAKDDPRRAMVPEFEAAAFSLEPGKVSQIVTTEYGFHIIKLHEVIRPKKLELAEVQGRIREALISQMMEKEMPLFFERLKRDAGVQVLDEKYALGLAPSSK